MSKERLQELYAIKDRINHADRLSSEDRERIAEIEREIRRLQPRKKVAQSVDDWQGPTLEDNLQLINEKFGNGRGKVTTKKEVAVIEKNEVATMQVMERLLGAVKNDGLTMEMLEKFMDLAERNEKREAEKAFNKAFSDFKANPPEIIKDKKVNYSNTSYEHASIGNVVRSIMSGMAKFGLSHRWITKQDGSSITVTCRISHFLGHYEETSITAGADQSGGKNAIQAIASTITYLERYTLQAATGIAVLENDDDGEGAGDTPEPPTEQDIYGRWVDQADAAAKVGYKALKEWYTKSKPQRDKLPANVTDWLNKYVAELKDAIKPQEDPPETVKCPNGGEMTRTDCAESECASTFDKCSAPKGEFKADI